MFSVVRLSVCLSRFTPLTVWTLDTASAFWLVKLKPDLIQPSTDKTSLSQPKTDDISFDKSQLLQCGGIHGHYVPLVLIWLNLQLLLYLPVATCVNVVCHEQGVCNVQNGVAQCVCSDPRWTHSDAISNPPGDCAEETVNGVTCHHGGSCV